MIRRAAALLSVLFLLAMQPATGEEWAVLGARARGMGGAGVANSAGAASTYWNPALLGIGQQHKAGLRKRLRFSDADLWSVGIPIGIELSAQGGLLADADKMRDAYEALFKKGGIQTKMDAGTPLSQAQVGDLFRFVEDVNKLNQPGKGLVTTIGGGVSVNAMGFGVSGLVLSYGGVQPVVDLSVTGGAAISNQGVAKAFDALKGVGGTFDTVAPTDPSRNALAGQLAGILAAAGITSFGTDPSITDANTAAIALVNKIPADVNVSDPTYQQALAAITTATANNSGATTGSSPTIDSNNSGIRLNGVVLQEAFVTLSQSIVPNRFGVGVNFKVVNGVTFDKFFNAASLKEGGEVGKDLRDELSDATTEDVFQDPRFTIDLGAVIQPWRSVRVGWTGRNLIPVRFDFETDPKLAATGVNRREEYEVDPQHRLGLAWQPFRVLTFSADYDMTKNTSDALPGYESQTLGGGAELTLPKWWLLGFALRAGAYQNLALEDEGLVYTGGVGIRIWKLELEAAAAISEKKEEIETDATSGKKDEFPQRVAGALQIGLNVTF